ncbi:hypothetical protein D770_05125 [Flammeovirgaceae bacterium 311]|nr:hypothetical protein D770_05125 [Flammeovirgaceae bacterium 311]
MSKEQCPICYSELEVVDCAPCHDCGHLPEEVEHFKNGRHKYRIYNVFEGLRLQLCDFCDVDFGSYKSEYFGLENGKRITLEDFEIIQELESRNLVKDKYCRECNKRLRFLTFLRNLREMNKK